jgi:hypothetical protein
VLHGDGSYERLSPPPGEQRICAQETFLAELALPN